MKTTTDSLVRAVHQVTVTMWMFLTGCLAGPSGRADTLKLSERHHRQNHGRLCVTKFAAVAPKPFGVVFDSRGDLYAASAQLTSRISRISSNGTVTTLSPLVRSFDATQQHCANSLVLMLRYGARSAQRADRTSCCGISVAFELHRICVQPRCYP